MKDNKRPTWQRVAALIVVILWLAMIIASLVCAIARVDKNIVFALIFCDIIIPILAWVFLRITKNFMKKGRDMADEYNRLNNDEEEK